MQNKDEAAFADLRLPADWTAPSLRERFVPMKKARVGHAPLLISNRPRAQLK
jgi:hypothetical protein